MGIFIKRPLCLFCFSFIAASLAACLYDGRYNLYLFFACLFAFIVCLVLSLIIKKKRYGLYEAMIALLMAILALVSSFVFIDRREDKAKELCGEELTVEFLVLEQNYASNYSSSYDGKLISVNGRKVSVPSMLKCSYEGEYALGETIFTLATVSIPEKTEDRIISLPSDIILLVTPTVEKEQAIIYKDSSRFDVFCTELRQGVKDRFMKLLDFDSAALSIGLVTGNKDALATEVIRDFRRAGLSHVLAVSGLHLAIVIGSVELLMRRLYVKKSLRCLILALLSFVLLMLSGFSASACRSVIMLLITYFVYILSRESDALTSLGIAGFVILLFSPRAVGDVGFWLSFLATFGLVTWLKLVTDLRRASPEKKGRLKKLVDSAFCKVLMIIATSVCATLSICVVSWLVFGEISLIGPISNLVVTPLCEVYLMFSLIVFILGGIPLISTLFSFIATFLSRLIVGLSAFFSAQSFSVISLRYRFAGVIIVLATLLMLLLLILKLRHKRIILSVPIVAIASFFICFFVYNSIYNGTRATYINSENKDAIVLTKGRNAIVFDISDGTYTAFGGAVAAASDNYATEIFSIVLTHYHSKHISSLDSILRSEMVRSVYIPTPHDDDELAIAHSIALSAEENGVLLVIYDHGEEIFPSDEMSFCVPEPTTRKGSTKKIINFCVMTEGKLLTYADSSWELGDNAYKVKKWVKGSDILILGSHGPEADLEMFSPLSECKPEIVISSARNTEGVAFDFYIASEE